MHTIVEYDNTAHRLQVIDLWQAVLGYKDAHNDPRRVIDKKLAVHDGLFFVAWDAGTVVGTIMAGYDGHRGWLYSVAVLPSRRHQGIGADLVRHAEHALLRRGCVKINLMIVAANEAVSGFYQTLGYQVEPRIAMGKRCPENCAN